jgi:uroporphyrinogen-III synthase
MRPLVILRPEPGASATADAARRLGLEPILIPLFQIEPVAWTAPDPSNFDGLLLTSANAVRAGGRELRKYLKLPVHAVGEATAAAARGEGFQVETVGSGGVESLLASLPPNLKLLHLSGADRREPTSAAQRISVVSVYRSTPLPLPENFRAVVGAVVAVHSPRAGARLAELARDSGLELKSTLIAAISAETATAVGKGWQQVEATSEPNERALLALAARLCQNPAR